MVLVIISAIMFAGGENLISAFLPEIVPVCKMGRMSGYGWSLAYLDGLMTLGLCLGAATKDVGTVVEVAERAHLARRVARLEPVVCIKG